jgi:transcriptional regulator with XRE-family HTH domain
MTGRALIAWNLRRLRTERGVSQGRLAEVGGVNQGHLRELERENVNITVDLLDRTADALGVRMARSLMRCRRGLKGRSRSQVDDRAALEPQVGCMAPAVGGDHRAHQQTASNSINASPVFCVATEVAGVTR